MQIKHSFFLICFLFSFLLSAQTHTINVLRSNQYRTACQITITEDPIANIVGVDPNTGESSLKTRWDSSDGETILDENGQNALNTNPTGTTFTGNVATWKNKAIDPNTNLPSTLYHLETQGNSLPVYYPSSLTPPAPYYKNNSNVSSLRYGVNEEIMISQNTSSSNGNRLIDINEDFTFVFVMKGNSENPSNLNSFISSSDNYNFGVLSRGTWQFGYRNGNFVLISTLLTEDGHIPTSFLDTGLPYDNDIHIWIFTSGTDPEDGNRKIQVYADGEIVNSLPETYLTIDFVKLFRNRANNNKLQASFYEFFLYEEVLTVKELEDLSYQLQCKWAF